MKNKPVVIIVAALGLGVLFFTVLYLAALIAGGNRATSRLSPLPSGEKVALVKIEGLLLTAEAVVDEINEYAED
jgi:hypothetical protein